MRLFGRSDRQLAATKYAGRESASQRAERLEADASADRRKGHRRSLLGTARAGERWDEEERRRIG